MSKIIGIDLGTTFSCVAVMEGGEPRVLAGADGSRTLPSVVSYGDDGVLVGIPARRQAAGNPEHTISASKRLMGRKFACEEVTWMQEQNSYRIVSSSNGDAHIRVVGKTISPQEVAARVLAAMREVAVDALSEAVSRAVVTVPAYFNDAQRQATRVAGKIAGLDVVRIINEPTAAALAHGIGQDFEGTVVVYDLGGGTFDVSVLEVSGGVYRVRATRGDTFLGGEDFDSRVVGLIREHCTNDVGFEPAGDKGALRRMKEAAEEAKIALSTDLETRIGLPFLTDNSGVAHNVDMALSRSEFEASTRELVERTVELCSLVLKDAEVGKGEIDDVILVGGMTRMPLVRKLVSEFFGRPVSSSVQADEAVALGAAIQGAIVAGECDEVLLVDVIPLSLGLETKGGIYSRLVERNQTVPVTRREVFATAVDFQSLVQIHVLQGERPMARDNKSLARLELVGMPPARRGLPKIEVAFHVDLEGILSVSAQDLATGKKQDMRVMPSGGLSRRDVQRLVAEAEEHRSADVEVRELADLMNRAELLADSTVSSLRQFGTYLARGEREEILDALSECRMALAAEDKEGIVRTMGELEKSVGRLSEVLYQQGQSSS